MNDKNIDISNVMRVIVVIFFVGCVIIMGSIANKDFNKRYEKVEETYTHSIYSVYYRDKIEYKNFKHIEVRTYYMSFRNHQGVEETKEITKKEYEEYKDTSSFTKTYKYWKLKE